MAKIFSLSAIALAGTLLFSAHGFAVDVQEAENQALKEYVKLYNSSKNLHHLARRTNAHGGIDLDQALEIYGSAYMENLPKISFNLGEKTISFNAREGTKSRKVDVKFRSIIKGEITVNGVDFLIDPRLSATENAVLLSRAMAPRKRASFTDFIVGSAVAQTNVGKVNYREYETPKISALRETTALGILDSPLNAISATGSTGTVVGAKVFGIGAGFSALVATLAALPGHYGIKKAHAFLAPNCREQAAEIAKELLKMKQVMTGLSCENMFADPQIHFSDANGTKRTLHANWERQDAYFDGRGPLYVFDRNQLTEIRSVEGLASKYDKTKGEESGYEGDLMSFKSGSVFEKGRAAIEPYRRVLNIMGKYESCYKCEAEFHNILVKNTRGDVEGPNSKELFQEAVAEYGRLASQNVSAPAKTAQ